MREIFARFDKYMIFKHLNDNQVTVQCGLAVGLIGQARKGKSDLGKKTIDKILTTYQDLNRIWLLTGEGEMLASDKPTISTTTGVPYYNVDFALGFDMLQNDQTTNYDYLVDFNPYNKCTCWVNAHGDSMSPTITSGDIVALQKVEDFRYLLSGEIYAIVTSNGLRTIKRVNDMGDSLCLVPDNKSYKEQVIPKKEIVAVFLVRGCVKTY